MSDIEAGRWIEKVEQLTLAVNDLTQEMKDLRQQAAYGKGVLFGMLSVAGAVGAAVAWLLGKVF
jgi:hypothetical protein